MIGVSDHTPTVDDGTDLFLCSVCGSAEGATTTDCPQRRYGARIWTLVYEGRIDFRKGHWIRETSPHSPKAHRERQLAIMKEVAK